MRQPVLLVLAVILSLVLTGPVLAQSDPVPASPRPPASAVNPDRHDARDRDLPATASPLAVTGILGFLSLGGAALLRSCRRKF